MSLWRTPLPVSGAGEGRRGERDGAEPFHTGELFPQAGVPVKGGAAVPQGCGAQRSTLYGVAAGKTIASGKRFSRAVNGWARG